jgi:hypothetical protein
MAKLKTKKQTILYGSILGFDSRFRCCVGSLLRSCKCSPFTECISHSLFLFFIFIPLLGWIISNWKNKIDFLQASYMVLAVCSMYYWICLPQGHKFYAFRLIVCTKTIFVVDPLYTIPLVTFDNGMENKDAALLAKNT